jgi:F420-dependent oxidoreductase-like protein
VRLALMIEGQEGVTWEQWLALAHACEEHGVETLFRSDHYLSFSDPRRNQSLDAWTTLAGLAAATNTLRLGTLVSPVTFRHPYVLANAAATVDQISFGRVELGMGGGWNVPEHEAFGIPFPDVPERMALLLEQVEIVHRLWTEDDVDFTGARYRLQDAPGLPKPVQKPHPPLLVGGSGGRGTATAAARWADEYNTPFGSPERIAERRRRVRETCEREGRDPDSLRFSLMTGLVVGEKHARLLFERLYGDEQDFDAWRARYAERGLVGDVDEIAARIREYEEAGCERIMLQHLLHDDLETVRIIGRELAPTVA